MEEQLIEYIDDFITVAEAMLYLQRTKSQVCKLCRDGKFRGARKVGSKVWLIPRKSVEDYKPGPRGRHAGEAKNRAEETTRQAEVNEAIREVQGLPTVIHEPQSGQEAVATEYISVAEAAKRLNRPLRAIRSWCQYGWFVGACKSDKKGKEWRIPVGSLDGALKHVRVYNAAKIKAQQAAETERVSDDAGSGSV